MTSFASALAAGPIVLDGGLGTLLESHGHDLSSSLWSAKLLLEDPAAIRRAHAEFYRAGARVAISSSYQVSYGALDAVGLTRGDVDELLRRSVQIAREARESAGLSEDEAWVAASVGPYGASRADGSEYTGAYDLGLDALREWHRPRLHALAAASPDAIAVETVPSLVELEAICREVDGIGIPTWLSVTVADGALRSGDAIADAFALARSVPEVVAVGVNCCDAADVGPALTLLADGYGVVYPNSGERWNAESREWSGAASVIAASVGEWISEGARLVGGCCRVGPDEIRAIAREVAARSPQTDPAGARRA